MGVHSYAFFDFDGTLLRGDSIVRFCRFARKKGAAGPLALLRAGALAALYGLRVISAERAKAGALAFLKGWTDERLAPLADAFCREELLPRLYPDALAEIRRLQKEDARVWLVSASPEFYLRPLERALGLDAIIATRYEAPEGRVAGRNCRGTEKVLRIAELMAARGEEVDYAASWAYGDSRGDAPMLRLCGHKVAVNPRRGLTRALAGADGVQTACWRNRKDG